MIDKYDIQNFTDCLPFLGDKPVVFDVGAHKGEYTDMVKRYLPNADCYLFEPNKVLYNQIKHDNKFPVAVSHINGKATFYQCNGKHSELSSLYKRDVFEQAEWTVKSIDSVTLDHVCDNGKSIDFLKVDVEGAEFDVMIGAYGMLLEKRIKFMQFEYGGTYIDADQRFKTILANFKLLGYRVYENGKEVTYKDFVEDYRYALFLITYIDLYAA